MLQIYTFSDTFRSYFQSLQCILYLTSTRCLPLILPPSPQVQEMISAAKFIQPSLGDLPGALKARLADSNKNLIITTLNIISSLAGAMGSGCSKFARVFVAGTISTLSDSKVRLGS